MLYCQCPPSLLPSSAHTQENKSSEQLLSSPTTKQQQKPDVVRIINKVMQQPLLCTGARVTDTLFAGQATRGRLFLLSIIRLTHRKSLLPITMVNTKGRLLSSRPSAASLTVSFISSFHGTAPTRIRPTCTDACVCACPRVQLSVCKPSKSKEPLDGPHQLWAHVSWAALILDRSSSGLTSREA